MATTANVLTSLGDRVDKREMGNQIAILCTDRSKPNMISTALQGRFLGLHDRLWAAQLARHSGATTYFVRVVPVFRGMTDPDGLPLMGTPTTENVTKGVTFSFDPFPDGYSCDGYRVYAGTVSGTLYFQGTLSNRFSTTFVIGSTWTYATPAANTLTAQTRGPRPYAHTLEVYQIEGNADSSVFMGGGRLYETGYAKVAAAAGAPLLTGGTAAQSTAATWAALGATGSFRMRLGWSEGSVDYDEMFDWTDVDFTGDATMANVATTFQVAIRAAKAPDLYCGTGVTTGITTWAAISDGAFDIYVDGAVVNVVSVDTSAATTMANVATALQAAWRVASSGSTETVEWDATGGLLIFKANIAAPTAASLLSYLSAPAAGTGTNIASMCDGLESSTTAVLNRRGKSATTAETVTWSTDHFIFTSSATGNQYRLSYLSTASGDLGTDVSVAAWTDAASTSNLASYVPGTTAKRTVQGVGTAWGTWAEGMKFRVANEAVATDHFVAGRYEDGQLLLDVDYAGTAAYAGYVAYKLLPFDTILNKSKLGNPFHFHADDTVELPTEDSDGITAIHRGGQNIYMFMRHHVWAIDGVDWTAPRQLTSQYGTVNPNTVVELGDTLFFYTGQEFIALSGGRFINLDPENRVRALMNRASVNVTYPHAVVVKTKTSDHIKWFMGLDSSFYHTVAVVYEPSSGNFWLEYQKDANCSAIVRSSTNVEYLVTGSRYDTAHTVPAFTFLHDDDYKSDGATTDSSKTVQGLILSVGTATETAGYLTCGTAGSAIGVWTAIDDAYFALTIDDTAYNVGPCDFTGDSDFDDVASTIQTAIRAQTSATETCTHDGTKFIITSSTTTNRSNVSYLRPYFLDTSTTDISSKTYMNGLTGTATETRAVSKVTLTLDDEGSNTAAMETGADGESGIWMYICDSNYRNGQYVLIASNTASTAVVTPNPSTTPVAGWHWYAGGIVPTWTKWFDMGGPQHLRKINGVAITVKPITDDTDNVMALHGMHDLSTTIRTTKTQALGGSNDTVNTLKDKDNPSTQQGYTIQRPSSLHDFKIEDITINHAGRY